MCGAPAASAGATATVRVAPTPATTATTSPRIRSPDIDASYYVYGRRRLVRSCPESGDQRRVAEHSDAGQAVAAAVQNGDAHRLAPQPHRGGRLAVGDDWFHRPVTGRADRRGEDRQAALEPVVPLPT